MASLERLPRPLIVDDHAIERHHIAYIETELRHYPLRKQRLARLESDVALATPTIEAGMPRPTGPGDPTPARADELSRLRRDPEYAALKRWTQDVEETFHALDLEQQQIVRRVYFQRAQTPERIAADLGIHVSTLYRQRNRALLCFCLVLVGLHSAKNLRKIPPLDTV